MEKKQIDLGEIGYTPEKEIIEEYINKNLKEGITGYDIGKRLSFFDEKITFNWTWLGLKRQSTVRINYYRYTKSKINFLP
jgi:hypothetical protein